MISKLSPEERMLKVSQEYEEKIQALNKRKGFRLVFEKIQQKKLTLVGHNMFLDSLYLINNLGETLPNSLKELKQIIQTNYGK